MPLNLSATNPYGLAAATDAYEPVAPPSHFPGRSPAATSLSVALPTRRCNRPFGPLHLCQCTNRRAARRDNISTEAALQTRELELDRRLLRTDQSHTPVVRRNGGDLGALRGNAAGTPRSDAEAPPGLPDARPVRLAQCLS